MELRDIEIFLTLAEELHFGRTAQRLHLSQARVSQSVKSQERRIGARLVDRSNPRNVQLTLLGRQLMAELLPAYRDLVKAIDHARLTARGISGLLRVGMIGFNAYDYQPFWDAFQARHPLWELQVRNISFNDPFGLLRRGDADIVIAWLPIEDPDLTVGPVIATEPMAAMMSDRHELAGGKAVSLEIFGDRGTFGPVMPPPEHWEDAYTPFHTPTGRPIERVVRVETWEELQTIIGTSDAVHMSMSHAARYANRPGITFVPIADSHWLRWALVWRAGSETEQIHALAEVVRDLGRLDQS
ncbi:LysR family transcriptional regulator [Streptomyces mirabilis]|uniref:LysR substrate-binding domain-containing protein n=1 Tax=Streptomyces mirabilis TaxID=68239 RepID=UPI0033A650B0